MSVVRWFSWVPGAFAALAMVLGLFQPVDRGPVPPRKLACVYSANSRQALLHLQNRLGGVFDCVMIYNDAAPDWRGWENPWFLGRPPADRNWLGWLRADHDRRLIITQSMIPGSPAADWRQRGALGGYDEHARTLARNLVKAGLGTAVIRLGHEANDTTYADNIGRTRASFEAWRRYWAKIVAVMRSVPGARFTFDWTVNAGYRPIPFSYYYPGDRYVDIVGMDMYDTLVPARRPSNPADRWLTTYAMPGYLGELAEFAQAHHKPLSIPEWGLVGTSRPDGAGDNPGYVDGIAQVVRSRDVAYQSYFNRAVRGTLLLDNCPRSLAAYRRAFALGDR